MLFPYYTRLLLILTFFLLDYSVSSNQASVSSFTGEITTELRCLQFLCNVSFGHIFIRDRSVSISWDRGGSILGGGGCHRIKPEAGVGVMIYFQCHWVSTMYATLMLQPSIKITVNIRKCTTKSHFCTGFARSQY